ncbi:MAG: sterol desaturase family protein [Rhodothermales bacterium]
MLGFFGWLTLALVVMEVVAYVTHRFLFHGVLWFIHESHHRHTHGPFELNDVFSLGFAAISMVLMYLGRGAWLADPRFAIGLGIAIYGILYFIIHDLFTHKRFWPFKSTNNAMHTVRRAHQRHHQSAERPGQEPYGLFLFPYDRYNTPFQRKRKP